jgi:hypothetical protein
MALLATISFADARANESTEIVSTSRPALAFARYVAFLDKRDVFTESGPVAVEISASTATQGTQAFLEGIRDIGASEHSEYSLLQLKVIRCSRK